MCAVLSGHTKKSEPAAASRVTLSARMPRIAAWSPLSQNGMERASAMQSSVTSGWSCGPRSANPCRQ